MAIIRLTNYKIYWKEKRKKIPPKKEKRNTMVGWVKEAREDEMGWTDKTSRVNRAKIGKKP